MRTVLEEVVDKIKTHILYSITLSRSSAVYEIMSKNMVKPYGVQMTSQYGAYEFDAG
jgi:hypothetical protein